jgi:hypothetical protein
MADERRFLNDNKDGLQPRKTKHECKGKGEHKSLASFPHNWRKKAKGEIRVLFEWSFHPKEHRHQSRQP